MFKMHFTRNLIITLLVFQFSITFSQISLVKDINTGLIPNASADTRFLTVLNSNTMLFSARTPEAGEELWKTDGTEAGTILLKDINPTGSSSPTLLTKIGSVIYFLADDGVNGKGLWKTDGTVAGTVLVKVVTSNNALTIREMVDVNGTLFFLNSSTELWKSDGTEAGTTMIRNDLGSISYLCSMNGAVYFSATVGTIGNELWKSDGTANGTTLVKDISNSTFGSSPRHLTNVDGVLYFYASTSETGMEVWKSDGTTSGTVLLKDINPGESSSQSQGSRLEVIKINNTIYFRADDGIHGYELWKSDGTDAGTTMVRDLNIGAPSSDISSFINVNGTLYFTFYDILYKTDGTAQGTVSVRTNASEKMAGRPILLNGILYYEAYTVDVGYALWKSDGTIQGTSRIKDINSYRNDYFYYTINFMTAFNGAVFFSGYNDLRAWELWKTDGTADGTNVLKEINMQGSSGIDYLARMGNHVYFRARDGIHGIELWRSDGTSAGTTLVKDINPFDKDGIPSYMTAAGNTLYFYADDGVHGRELWKSDGTTAGTIMVKDAVPGSGNLFSFSRIPEFRAVDNVVYFSSYTDTQEAQLWRSDGTESGTYALTSKPAYSIFNINSTIYFSMDDGVNGAELWKTDGTVEGTVMVKDINPTGSSSLTSFVNVNGILYFSANDGVNGEELWKSDGTTNGTVMVKDINPLGSSFVAIASQTNNGATIPNVIYFSASNATEGRELWKTDGTAQGTVIVKDINQGATGSNPTQLTMVNNILYFTIFNNSTGPQLWRSDGTSEGTVKVKDDFRASPGFTHDLTLKLFIVGDMLYVLSAEFDAGLTELYTINALNACKVAENKDLYIYDPYVIINKKVFIRSFSYQHGGVELFMYDGSNDEPCKKAQTISFAELPTDLRGNDEPFTATVTASSGLPVSLISSNTEVATTSGTTIIINAPGETEITAIQEGDDTWAAAEPVTQVLFVDLILSAEENLFNGVQVFPNPFHNNFSLTMSAAQSVDASIKVYSITGSQIEQISPHNKVELLLGSSWPKGVYLVQIVSENKIVTRKVVKE